MDSGVESFLEEVLTASVHSDPAAALVADVLEIPPVIGDILELVRAARAMDEGRYGVAALRLLLQAGPLPQIPLFNTILSLMHSGGAAQGSTTQWSSVGTRPWG